MLPPNLTLDDIRSAVESDAYTPEGMRQRLLEALDEVRHPRRQRDELQRFANLQLQKIRKLTWSPEAWEAYVKDHPEAAIGV